MKTAVITASYHRDFERCQFLCETMDARLKGDWTHYILVDNGDAALFATLKAHNRIIICERDLFPFWFRSFPDFLSSHHDKVWLSPFSKPLRGWHAQQLRRLAICQLIDEEVMLTIDSDAVMVRDFHVDDLVDGQKIRFFQKRNGLSDKMDEHLSWSGRAGAMLGIEKPGALYHDYIANFICWRTETVRNLLQHIESVNGQSWFRTIIKDRAISECFIYGRFVEEVEGLTYHRPTDQSLCHSMWFDETDENNHLDIAGFMRQIQPEQVAVAIQSFIPLDITDLRAALSLAQLEDAA